jgi:hypothetical protein
MTMEQKTTSEESAEVKQKPVETVDVVLTVKLPKPWLPILTGLSELVDKSIEAILLDELYGVLDNFFSGGFLEGWIEYAMEQKGLDKARTEQLEDMITKIQVDWV